MRANPLHQFWVWQTNRIIEGLTNPEKKTSEQIISDTWTAHGLRQALKGLERLADSLGATKKERERLEEYDD